MDMIESIYFTDSIGWLGYTSKPLMSSDGVSPLKLFNIRITKTMEMQDIDLLKEKLSYATLGLRHCSSSIVHPLEYQIDEDNEYLYMAIDQDYDIENSIFTLLVFNDNSGEYTEQFRSNIIGNSEWLKITGDSVITGTRQPENPNDFIMINGIRHYNGAQFNNSVNGH